MPLYRIGPLYLQSNLSFPEVQEASTGETNLRFTLHTHMLPPKSIPSWVHHWYDAAQNPVFSLAKGDGYYVLRAYHLADFILYSGERAEIACYPLTDKIAQDTIRHLVLDQVIPRYLNMIGQVVLHASAVRLDQFGVGFLGHTGSGKSTLAAFLVAKGARLISDDCLVLQDHHDHITCYPYYANLRLWSDSIAFFVEDPQNLPRLSHMHQKRRFSSYMETQQTFDYNPQPLRCIYILEQSPDASIRSVRVAPREAFMEAISGLFSLDVTDETCQKHNFECIANLIEKVPFYRLIFPSDYEALPHVQKYILEHLM